MTSDELIILLEEEMQALANDLIESDYTNAVAGAERETWTMPQTDDFKIHWVKERSKRHLFFMLMTGVSMKFKAKVYSIDQKFTHLKSIVEMMDKAFEKVKEEFPDAFPVLSDSDIEGYALFGTYIRPGFQYDGKGKDTTYDSTNEPMFSPDETDEE